MKRYAFLLFFSFLIQAPLQAQQAKDSIEFANFFYDALRNLAIDNSETALQNLEQCSGVLDKEPSALYLRASIHIKNKELEKALPLLEKAYRYGSDNWWYAKALGNVYFEVGKAKKAKEIFRNYHDKHTEKEETTRQAAQLMEQRKETEEALFFYEHYCNLVDNPKRELMRCAMLNFQMKHFSKANHFITILLDNYPSDYKLWLFKADLLTEEGKNDELKQHFDLLLKEFPKQDEVQMAYVSYLFKVKDYAGLKPHLLPVFSNSGIQENKKIALIKEIIRLNNFPISALEVTNLIDTLTVVHPYSTSVSNVAAGFYYNLRLYAKALPHLTKLRRSAPNQLKVWSMEMTSYLYTKQGKVLEQVADSAIMYYPNQPIVYYYRAQAAFSLQQYEQCIEFIDIGQEFIIDNKGLSQEFLLLKAQTFAQQKKFDESITLYERLLISTPNSAILQNNYAYMLCDANKNLDKAARLMQQVLSRNANQYNFFDTYAWVLFKQKKYESALEQIRFALKKGGQTDPTVWEHCGDICIAMGKKQEAIDAYKAALQQAPQSAKLKTKLAVAEAK